MPEPRRVSIGKQLIILQQVSLKSVLRPYGSDDRVKGILLSIFLPFQLEPDFLLSPRDALRGAWAWRGRR